MALMAAGRLVLEAAVVSNMAALTHLPDGVAAFAHSLFSQISRFSSVAVGVQLAAHLYRSCFGGGKHETMPPVRL